MPFHEETLVLRLKSPQTPTSVHTTLQRKKRTLSENHPSVRTSPTTPPSTGPSTPTNISPLQEMIVPDAQSSTECNTPFQSRSWDTTHLHPASFEQACVASPKLQPSFIVTRSVTFVSHTTPEPQDLIASQEQNQGVLFEHPSVSRTRSFCTPVFKCRSERSRRASFPSSRSASNALPSPLPTKPTLLKKCPKRLQKAPSVPIMAGRSKARKSSPPPRTRPYEAPYFFPTPGSPAAADYGRQFRATPMRRAATAHEPLVRERGRDVEKIGLLVSL